MDLLNELRKEYDQEYQITRRFFEMYPDDKNSYKPHEKSMAMMPLAQHIAEVFAWPAFILQTDGIDFAEGGERPKMETREDLLKNLDESYKQNKEALQHASLIDMEPTWSLKMNGEILVSWSKYEAIRHALNQATHHRAQLGVYYRLNDIPLPSSYGPSADEQSF